MEYGLRKRAYNVQTSSSKLLPNLHPTNLFLSLYIEVNRPSPNHNLPSFDALQDSSRCQLMSLSFAHDASILKRLHVSHFFGVLLWVNVNYIYSITKLSSVVIESGKKHTQNSAPIMTWR